MEMTYEKLQDLWDEDKARIIDTTLEGTCQLWEVDGHSDLYVVDCDNQVQTQAEDNEGGRELNDPELVLFPF